jgi:RNA polymerase sigma factor (sigma-70 family)
MTRIFQLGWTEEKIIVGCRKGDRKAQQQLYEKFAGKMLSTCRRYTKSIEDAEEVLSNGFIKVFSKFDSYRGDGALEGWLRKIMVRESLNYIRYQKNLFVEVNLEQVDQKETADSDAKESADLLIELIDRLPLGYRTVFNLFAIEGYNHKEISEMLEISEGTSKSQLSKARQQLQSYIQEQKLTAVK